MAIEPRAVVAAVDIGGTRIKAALVDASYNVVLEETTRTPRDVAGNISDVVRSTVFRMIAQANQRDPSIQLVGTGVVVPGVVDEVEGIGRLSVNLGWSNLQIRELIAPQFDVPTVVGHDVRAGLLAEKRLGAACEHDNVLFMPVGTGIAGALMLDGVIISAEGWAGELGHVIVEPDGLLCRCGQHGCLETRASAASIERAYAAAMGRVTSAEEVAARYVTDDAVAVAVWTRAVAALAQAIVLTVTLTGLDLVVMGGGLAQSRDVLLAPLRAEVAARLTFQRAPKIVGAALGDRAGSLGAACLAWDAL